MLHLPILRGGEPYRSLEQAVLPHVKTGEPVALVSQANPGLVSRDLAGARERRKALLDRTVDDLIAVCGRAARLFATASLPVDPIDGVVQSPEDYIESLSATTGMPLALCRGNMDKIRFVLSEMETVLGGLSRGLDLTVLDGGWIRQGGRVVSYVAQTDTLSVVLPSNSPGVHSLWLPAIPLKVTLALKPGRLEPWTPMRVLQALLEAGCPREALGFYPTDYSGASQLLLRGGRSMFFGDASSVRGWKDDPAVEIHGPGWSKVILGEDAAGRWNDHLDVIVASIAANGGRSCLNASGVWTPVNGRTIAEAVAERLAAIEARPLDDPSAEIAAFPDPAVAHRISGFVDRQLRIPGAVDLTAAHRSGARVVERDGCTFVLPTLIWCEDPTHPLASTELLFPFASVVEVPRASLLEAIGPTLVGTVITEDESFIAELAETRHIDRLNLGPIPTARVSWDQPHEGNLFEHLYRQRAFQSAVASGRGAIGSPTVALRAPRPAS